MTHCKAEATSRHQWSIMFDIKVSSFSPPLRLTSSIYWINTAFDEWTTPDHRIIRLDSPDDRPDAGEGGGQHGFCLREGSSFDVFSVISYLDVVFFQSEL